MLILHTNMNKYIKFILQPPITRSFGKKLKQNLHTLTPGEMIIYFLFIRPFWSKDKRFFFEGSLPLLGQMSISERKGLYDTILNEKPRQCFEIGTYTGGGSTYYLASALAKTRSGELITMENSEHYFNKAKNYFSNKLPNLNKVVRFIFGSTPNAFDSYVTTYDKVDCVFFDGAENGEQTLEQYQYFLPYFKKGSVIMFHDWNTEKTKAVRPLVLQDARWGKILELQTPYSAVGFTVFKHK